jgi:hypothetical protein
MGSNRAAEIREFISVGELKKLCKFFYLDGRIIYQ